MNLERVILSCSVFVFIPSSAIDFQIDLLRSLAVQTTPHSREIIQGSHSSVHFSSSNIILTSYQTNLVQQRPTPVERYGDENYNAATFPANIPSLKKSPLPSDVRKQLIAAATNITVWSRKLQNTISGLELQKNLLNNETMSLIEKEKEILEKLRMLDAQMRETNDSILSAKRRLEYDLAQNRNGLERARKAHQDLKQYRNEKPIWYCFLWFPCVQNWVNKQKTRIKAAEKVLASAKRQIKNAMESVSSRSRDIRALTQELMKLQLLNAASISAHDESRRKILESTNLSETVLTILKDLTTIKMKQILLKDLLYEKLNYEDEDIGFNWDAIESALKNIASYINDGGFVNDIAKWGIYIKGFDVKSFRSLGVLVDRATANLLDMA